MIYLSIFTNLACGTSCEDASKEGVVKVKKIYWLDCKISSLAVKAVFAHICLSSFKSNYAGFDISAGADCWNVLHYNL